MRIIIGTPIDQRLRSHDFGFGLGLRFGRVWPHWHFKNGFQSIFLLNLCQTGISLKLKAIVNKRTKRLPKRSV